MVKHLYMLFSFIWVRLFNRWLYIRQTNQQGYSLQKYLGSMSVKTDSCRHKNQKKKKLRDCKQNQNDGRVGVFAS